MKAKNMLMLAKGTERERGIQQLETIKTIAGPKIMLLQNI